MQNENVPTPPGHIKNLDGSFSIIKKHQIVSTGEANVISAEGIPLKLSDTEFEAVFGYKPNSKKEKSDLEETAEEMIKLSWPEKPLTHHQQALKEFMVSMVNAILVNPEKSGMLTDKMALEAKVSVPEYIAGAANAYADAFVNQINKKVDPAGDK